MISIHAPHARSDTRRKVRTTGSTRFQSTLLMRGATLYIMDQFEKVVKFQSTLLMRGATAYQTTPPPLSHFNPRSSCEERPVLKNTDWVLTDISIHAPHARSDRPADPQAQAGPRISIHAPHARSDRPTASRSRGRADFNPRSSCEERRVVPTVPTQVSPLFQSTLLMRGATDL